MNSFHAHFTLRECTSFQNCLKSIFPRVSWNGATYVNTWSSPLSDTFYFFFWFNYWNWTPGSAWLIYSGLLHWLWLSISGFPKRNTYLFEGVTHPATLCSRRHAEQQQWVKFLLCRKQYMRFTGPIWAWSLWTRRGFFSLLFKELQIQHKNRHFGE